MVKKNLPRKSTLSSRKTIVAKLSEIEMKQINDIGEICESNCFECSTKNEVVKKEDLIINKDMDMEIWSPQYKIEF